MKRILIAIALLAWAGQGWGATRTFYFDGSCANFGNGTAQTCGAWHANGPHNGSTNINWTTHWTNNLSSWANDNTAAYDTFTTSGANISSAIQTGGPKTTDAKSNTVTTVVGKIYQLMTTVTLTSGQAPTLTGTGGFPTTTLIAGAHTVTWAATGTSTQLTLTSTDNTSFALASSTWYCDTVKAEIDYGNNVVIQFKGGTTTTTGNISVGYGGSSDNTRVTLDGAYSVWPGETGTNAIIDSWVAVTGSWSAADNNGVYNIAWNPLGGVTPTQVFEDAKTTTALMKKQAAATWVGEAGTWYWASNILYYKPSTDNATNHTLYTFNKSTTISNNAKNYVTISNLIAKGANYAGIDCTGGTGCKVQNSVVTESYMGIIMRNSSIGAIIGGAPDKGNEVYNTWGPGGIYNLSESDNAVISYNTVHDANNQNLNATDRIGIAVDGEHPGANVIIEYNTLYNNGPTNDNNGYSPTISVYQAVGSIIRYNYIYNNYNGCISITTTSTGTQAYYNKCIGNGLGIGYQNEGDIFVSTSDNVTIYNNTCSGNANNVVSGLNGGLTLNCPSGTCNTTVKNNIFGSPTNNYSAIISGTFTGANISNNIYEKAGDQFYYDGAAHSFADWKTNLSGDANSLQADPKFTSVADNNFILLSSSPAINAGVDVGLTTDYAGNPIRGLPDIGAYESSYPSGTYRGRMGIHWLW